MRKILLSLLTALGLGTACSSAEITTLSPSEFRDAAASDTTAVILDVRKPQEFADGHLKGAISLDYLNQKVFSDEVKKLDNTRTYYVYCRSGRRSHAAAELMQKAGLKVIDMKGGIMGWQMEGLPVSK